MYIYIRISLTRLSRFVGAMLITNPTTDYNRTVLIIETKFKICNIIVKHEIGQFPIYVFRTYYIYHQLFYFSLTANNTKTIACLASKRVSLKRKDYRSVEDYFGRLRVKIVTMNSTDQRWITSLYLPKTRRGATFAERRAPRRKRTRGGRRAAKG